MSNTGFWIIVLVAVFMFGSFMSVRISPREKALGEMRDRARKLGFLPRLIAAPEWIKHKTYSGKPGGMVAYYSIVLPQSTHPLMQARVVDGQLKVEKGSPVLQDVVLDPRLKGIQAREIQANRAGCYGDEDVDLHGEQLETMKSVLVDFADRLK
ncbi:MAG: hypothetical protein NVS3B3_22200 [Aquirhabdus sp.]